MEPAAGAAGGICRQSRFNGAPELEPAATWRAGRGLRRPAGRHRGAGLGFGATIMALNTYAETLFPESADRAVLVLNALLGLGTALAPGTGRNRRRDRRMVAAPGRSGVHSGADLWCCSDRTAESPRPDCRLQRAGHRFGRSAAPVLALCCRRGIIETLNANWAILYVFCMGLFFLVRTHERHYRAPKANALRRSPN